MSDMWYQEPVAVVSKRNVKAAVLQPATLLNIACF
jgi:hypothetical protein